MRGYMKHFFCVFSLSTILASTVLCNAGMVSLTFDDGIIGTYRHTFPILKKYNQPGTVALIYSRLISKNEDYMNIEQALEMQKGGWEVASHSLTHKRPIEIPQLYQDEPVRGWTLEDKKLHIYQTNYDYTLISFLLEGDAKLNEYFTWDDLVKQPGSFYFDRVLEELHVRPLQPPADIKKLAIKSCSYEREMELSKKELQNLGFTVNTYITPYNYWTDALKEVSRKYYTYVATGSDDSNGQNDFDAHWIKRVVVHRDTTVNSLIRLIKEHAVQNDKWVVLCLHEVGDGIGWEPWSAKRFDTFCAWLEKEKIKVVTISEGASLMMARKGAAAKK